MTLRVERTESDVKRSLEIAFPHQQHSRMEAF
jgi:hypothetical protein